MNRVAMITGAGQGIGRALALAFVQAGYRVAIGDVCEDTLQETVAACGVGCAAGLRLDVSDEESVRGFVRQVVDTCGRLDVLINNAGIGHGVPLADLLLVDWNRVLGVNLTGPFLCAKHAAPFLKEAGGCIINIASTRAFMSERNTEAYTASKGGVVALTHALAVSLGPQVRVNCISPGWIDNRDWRPAGAPPPPPLTTEDHAQHPCGRVGHPGDVASLALWLADPANAFVTGSNFTVDGGMTRKMIYV